ncbi:MAG: hypothetical protein Q8918_06380 [Bacteroidota bacterium]|nr:hypothetical protein [Bacteroidota bacterium]MDP4211504.1 hypothetical protein [Bacteroidota bacterium]MDP4249719.1 hypothetical protein [Bacteroidota bacterium]
MIPHLRKSYNDDFSSAKYEAFLRDLNAKYPGSIDFRVAETPVFVPSGFRDKMINACESIVDLITDPDFKQQTKNAIPSGDFVPGTESPCSFIAFDFGVCLNENQELEPQLIEMQGFPTLYGFQVYYPDILRKHFSLPAEYTPYLNGYIRETYLEELKKVILGNSAPEQVILLEIKPHLQKTRIDFYCTRDYLGIQPVCITDLIPEGNQLYYVNDQTKKKTRVERIYNRIIFDDLHAQKDSLGPHISLQESWDVQWVPHPNWFYRISKHTLPFIRHPYVPRTFFLDQINQIPADLENYVLKPLFSFAGQGVIIDVKKEDIVSIRDPQNWILQRKVNYAPVIQTPDTPAKVEIRIMYLWPEDQARPKAAINLARLSKGKMIGVRYNKDQEWVGGSVALFSS